jgi:hypothetical protein
MAQFEPDTTTHKRNTYPSPPQNTAPVFHTQISKLYAELGGKTPLYRQALKAAQEQSYTFVEHDRGNMQIPRDVRQLMETGTCGAITLPEKKCVYLNLSALNADAQKRGIEFNTALAESLADEAVHIISNTKYRRWGSADDFETAKTEFRKMAQAGNSGPYTEAEHEFHKALNEEILSYFARRIAGTQLSGKPDYKLPKDALQNRDFCISNDDMSFADVKIVAARSLFSRMFVDCPRNRIEQESIAFKSMKTSDEKTVVRRIIRYLDSGEIEKDVTNRLQQFGLSE